MTPDDIRERADDADSPKQAEILRALADVYEAAQLHDCTDKRTMMSVALTRVEALQP